MTPRSFLAVSQNGQDLCGRDQCKPLLQALAKTPTPTNPAQLSKISCRHLNADSDKKQRKMTSFHEKNLAYKLLLATFWARMSSIFHACQFFIKSEHILDVLRPKKLNWIFTQFQPPFHRQADFQTLQQRGFHGGIPSSGIPWSLPNHFRHNKSSKSEILKHNPSPLCIVCL